MAEDVREIPSAPGYGVSRDGRVFSRRMPGPGSNDRGRWKERKTQFDRRGYVRVGLKVGGRLINPPVHRLVLEAFVGPCPEGMEARHLNGRRSDNRVDNLAWGTKVENQADKVAHGTRQEGARNGNSRLTDADVVSIRMEAQSGRIHEEIARDFGVSQPTVSSIVARRTWTHV